MKFTFGLLLVSSLLLKNVKSTIPECTDCDTFATGKDGSLWGWENDSFCKIPSSCSSSSKNSNESDSKTEKSKVTSATTTTKSSVKAKATSTGAATHEKDENGNVICNGCTVTGTGGNDSLWGWEDEASCIISKTKCEGKLEEVKTPSNSTSSATHEKDASGNLICNECNVTSTGGDGSYWGWEDEASCIIDNVKCKLSPPKTEMKALERGPDGILICSTCEYTRVDKDTTTWNTENGEDCRVIGSRCGINTTPHPWCSGCVVTGTGNDGALYGWENNSSCLINEITCGIVDSHGEYTQVSSAQVTKMNSLYYAMASLTALFVFRAL
ncbi:hypothetical protein U3516DRAFT_920371 [Neocallimastix sp. 'constans']|jgi:hypothetical protein